MKKVEFTLFGESLGHFPAEVCTKCSEEVFDEATSAAIDRIAKDKGLWGLESHTKITQVGSSYAVIINKKIADFTGLSPGRDVHIHPESKGRIVLEI